MLDIIGAIYATLVILILLGGFILLIFSDRHSSKYLLAERILALGALMTLIGCALGLIAVFWNLALG